VAAYAMRRDVSRGWLVLTFVVAVVLMTAEREIVRRIFWALRAQGWQRPVIIAGSNSEAVALAIHLAEHPRLGFSVVGFVDDTAPVGTELVPGASVLGPIANTLDLVRSTETTGVLVATSGVSTENTNRLARQLVYEGIFVQLTSSLCDIAAERLVVHPLGRRPVISVEPASFDGWRAVAKRSFDLALTLVAMVVLSPLLVLVAIAVKIDSRGPVFFRQTRVGRGGKPFKVWKFRTMFVDAEQKRAELWSANQADGPLFKVKDDPRVSRVGRWLRRHSIDELPQLLNVLRNEMSLVGPRPALPEELESWSVELHNRLRVKPGLTGMWQVSGRSDCSFAEYVRLDLYYVDNWTLITDLAIVAKTVPAILLRRGAY
jgi:exopolysaccharide biosynthesis polyprenyl glycosylphosphotransferase